MMNTHEELFNRFNVLGKAFQNLNYVVQNEGMKMTHDELDQFERNIEKTLAEMQKMKHFVIGYYQRNDLIKFD